MVKKCVKRLKNMEKNLDLSSGILGFIVALLGLFLFTKLAKSGNSKHLENFYKKIAELEAERILKDKEIEAQKDKVDSINNELNNELDKNKEKSLEELNKSLNDRYNRQ